jgi:hypothetical protein
MYSWLQLRALAICGALACCAACRRPVSKAPIIEQYRGAVCIPFSARPTVSPHTREWDTPLTLKDGERVIVRGTQSPGGRIEVQYANSGVRKVAADAEDYVYPSDVRVSNQNDLLFIKASGLAGGINHETWLFEYDLHNQHLVTQERVSDEAIGSECPENTISK